MTLQRRTFFAALLGCAVLQWSGLAIAQAPAINTTPADAAAAVSNSASLPPPAPLPASTMQALSTPAAPAQAFPAAPVAGDASGLPALPGNGAGPALGAAPLTGIAAPDVTMPLPPAAVTGVAQPVAGIGAPSALAGPVSDVPPVVIPTAPAERPDVIEPAKEIAPTADAPLVSTASGGPLLPTLPNQEILASRRLPLPQITPSSPLIPGPSLAETANQRRQLTTLPGSGGDTNYAHATIGGPNGPAGPLITPPTVIDPVQGSDIGKNYPPLQAVMPQAHATPFHLDSPSAFGTPSPAYSLTYYQSKTMRREPDMIQQNPSPTNAEIIVLTGGQEFQGLVHARGDNWRVQLLNGTIMDIPGQKVAHVRKLLPVATSTPSARSMVNVPMELYRERQTD